MAEYTAEEIQELIDKIKQGEATLDSYLEKVKSGDMSNSVFSKIAEQVGLATQGVDQFGNVTEQAFGKLSSLFGSINFTQMNNMYTSAKSALTDYTQRAVEMNESTNNALIETASVITTIVNPSLTSSSKLFGEFGNMGIESGRRISGNMEHINALASKFKIPADSINELVRLQENAADLEMAFIKMSLASGQAFKELESGGTPMDRSSDGMFSLAKRIDEISKQTGILPDKVQPLLVQFGSKLPGAMDKFSAAADGSGGTMDSLVKMLQVADGIGMSHNDMLNRVEQGYQKFGNSVDKNLDNLVLYNKTVQEIGIRQDTMLGFIDKSTQGMESMADATDSVIKLMGSLGRVMRSEVGVSEAGLSNIVSNMAQAAKNMDIGQASFINQAAGGRGGLAGGFEIELLKQQGNLGEIVNRTMQAMEKIGVGAPTTLQDVQNNPALAGQLMQQRELIKQFGLAQNDQDAYRVLEAMKAGGADELKEALQSMEDPQRQMLETLKDANKISSIGNNTMREIARSASKMSNTASIGVGGFLEKNIDQPLEKAFEREGIDFGANATEAASEGRMETTKVFAGTEDATSYSTQNLGDFGRTFSAFANQMKSALSSLSDMSRNSFESSDKISSSINYLSEIISQNSSTAVTDKLGVDVNNITASNIGIIQQQPVNPVVLDGNVKFDINIRDGLKSIFKESFAEEIAGWQKNASKGGITGT